MTNSMAAIDYTNSSFFHESAFDIHTCETNSSAERLGRDSLAEALVWESYSSVERPGRDSFVKALAWDNYSKANNIWCTNRRSPSGAGNITIMIYPANSISADQTVFLSSSEVTVESDFAWLDGIYSDGLNKSLAHELYPLVEHLDEIIDRQDFDKINQLLVEIELEKLSPALMSALLRTIYPGRDRISSWELALSNIKCELENRKETPVKWLRGLI